ncbi:MULTISPECIES: hypothetical protein [unclassified Microcoleus]|uniref:hypothetical protein n=1 Tax=unclassified Microcoleus TaxID=2642155 RepID=UPI002FD721B7
MGWRFSLFQRSIFSPPALLWSRPKETEVLETQVFAAFKDYLAADVEKVDRAAPVIHSGKLDSILPAQLRYLRYRAASYAGRGMLKRFCGEESTKRVYSRIFVRLGTEAATIGK